MLPSKRSKPVQFFINHVNLFGLDVQNWMIIVAVLIVAFGAFAWLTYERA